MREELLAPANERKSGRYTFDFDGDTLIVSTPNGTKTHNISENGAPPQDMLEEDPGWVQYVATTLFENYVDEEMNHIRV